MITSARNPLIQTVRALLGQNKARRDHGLYVIEGVRLVEEALLAGVRPHNVLYTSAIGARGEALIEQFIRQGVETTQVAANVLQIASDTKNSQGIMALLPQTQAVLPIEPDFILLLDQMRDPGNVGGVLRTAAAAGAQIVLLTPGSADPFAPKVLRAGMGAHFRLPVQIMSWDQILSYTSGVEFFVAEAHADLEYTEADLRQPMALIIGGEAYGADTLPIQLHPTPIKIPMPGRMESLNAATAAGILLFEVVRQRKAKAEK